MPFVRSSARLLAVAVLALPFAGGLAAQQPPPPTPPPGAGPANTLSWAPPELGTLATTASWHSDFVVDRSMLALAGNLYGVDDPTRQAIARLNGIALHLYRFATPAAYDPGLVDAIRGEYEALGWKHVATSKPVTGPVVGENGGRTDVWLNMQGINISGAVILLAGQGSVSLIGVSGDLRTLDLLHLRGHFGIPRFPDDALPH